LGTDSSGASGASVSVGGVVMIGIASAIVP